MPNRPPPPERPPLTPSLSEREFLRWYWTLAELQTFARSIAVSPSGRKADVTERLAASLAGRKNARSQRRSTVDQLAGPLTPESVIPPNQRSTQLLREFFESEIGPSFRFNGHMRAFLAEGGATLGDAVAHWHATRGSELPPQSESLEFNKFTKAWHRANPSGSPSEARTAWQRYRSLPTDQRPPVEQA